MEKNPFSDLDDLLLQGEKLAQTVEQEFPELFRNQTPAQRRVPSTSDAAYSGVLPAHGSTPPAQQWNPFENEQPVEEIDDNDLQTYRLRRKFFRREADARWESRTISQQNVFRPSGESVSLLSEEELFMVTLTQLADRMDEEAAKALALMLQRDEKRALNRFLPLFLGPENGMSRARMEQILTNYDPRRCASPVEQRLMACVVDMLQEMMMIVQEAEALQEQGYRNRQEVLRLAQEKSERRYRRLTSLL